MAAPARVPENGALAPDAASAMASTMPRRARSRYLLVALLAALLYLPAFWWGAPHATTAERAHAWGVDDETPLGPLTELRAIVHPTPGRNLGYPLGYVFMAAAAYSPYLAYLELSGGLGPVRATYPYGLADPVRALRNLTVIAHFLTVLLAVGVILCAYDAARSLWDERTALLTAAFAAVVTPMFYYGRSGNVDVPMLFFIALAVALYARAIRYGLTVRRAIVLGAAVGVALGTKESALGAFLAFPFVLAFTHWGGRREPAAARPSFKAPLVALLAAFLALGLSSGLFVEPGRYFAHIAFLRGRIESAATGEVIPFTYPNTWQGNIAFGTLMLQHLAALLTWAGLALAALGLGWTLLRERRSALLALPAFTYLGFMFVEARTEQLRYVLPAGFIMAAFAARAVVLGWQSRHVWLRVAVSAAGLYALGVCLLQGADLTWQMLHDSRYTAGEWLEQRAPAGTRIEYFGASQKLPPLRGNVETARANEFLGMFRRPSTDSAQAEEILAGWAARRPAFVLVIPDHSSKPGQPYDNTMPPRLYEALLRGDRGYRLAALFQTPRLFSWIAPIPLDYPVVNPPIRVFAPD